MKLHELTLYQRALLHQHHTQCEKDQVALEDGIVEGDSRGIRALARKGIITMAVDPESSELYGRLTTTGVTLCLEVAARCNEAGVVLVSWAPPKAS